MKPIALLASVLLAPAACRAPSAPPLAPTGPAASSMPAEPPEARTAAAETFQVRWRPAPAPVPLNRPFELEIELLDAAGERPLPGAALYVDAWMPAHLHGMLRRPEVEDLGGGRYRARGMLFHMRGHWQIRFDVLGADGRRTRATDDVELP